MVSVVGIGPGAPEYITPAALKRIKEAEVLVGAKRHLNLFKDLACKKIPLEAGLDLGKVLKSPGRVAVIATGDPGIYGILDLVLKHVSEEEVDVIPGISSVQYMMARLRLPAKDTAVVSLHGRGGDIVSAVRNHSTVVVLTDPVNNPVKIARLLLENGILDREIYVGQNLSYENEAIEKYGVKELAGSTGEFDINVVVIRICGNTESEYPMISF
ncbi:precorrin-6y C5,15-methyltransferase (decarboxylating) subunit CbiE [Thermosediminibacter oceani]|uniref:Precorrin-6y C5,15-methyltransferase (Decarboxylating), CbiE subunit n=1 Tax=Thermosediminibacter oceani (strain ATCC BAA-1034 / DSM 16646 / JW/IW-1228P) TaxID=555079 RepID=D9S0S9_THEOJ|nr:precorrin-6y C5,15-methyltransferase (decarboxylating) subunit CbiE [Thermosediminibacter oceani]ADL07093.1 precorrin-6y C5,15-methyltransferase (decarboxylating), CbiE subunit [Thermosediminibacter oceani DSM 16646]